MNKTFKRKTLGFSLIEVLVTVVVVSLGLLGFAGLLSQSVASNREAYFRSQATFVSYHIIERMRVNRAAAVGGAYTIAVGSAPSGTSRAAADLVDWKQLLTNTFPEGDGSVTTDGNGNVSIVIQWTARSDNSQDADGNETRQFATQSRI